MPYLGLLDVAGIQDYLFRSPELRDIAEASERIEKMGEPGGLFRDEAEKERGARMIIAAGGVAAMRAEDCGALRRVFRAVSARLLADGEGLEVVGAIHPYEEGQLASSYPDALAALERKKVRQPRATDFVFAGLGKPVPRDEGDIGRRRRAEEPADDCREVAGEPGGQWPENPRILDNMIGCGYWLRPKPGGGETLVREETGLMAVVSMDGLRMGQRFFDWLKDARERFSGDDEGFVQEFAAWSSFVKRRWRSAWEVTVQEMDGLFPGPHYRFEHPCQPRRFLELRRKGGERFRLCRRIYQGGDDLSFVCDARIALAFTTALMRRLEQPPDEVESIAASFRTLRVSAGVVFVDAHFPFSRAVRMADEVRQTAKKKAMEREPADPPSCLDWWVNRAGARNRPPREASVKPCPLDADPHIREDVGWRQMESALEGMWEQFAAPRRASSGPAAIPQGDEAPRDRLRENGRNKLKDLLTAAEAGPAAVRLLLSARPLREQAASDDQEALPFLLEGYRTTGFNAEGKRTLLLDAGELFDIHFPFPGSEAAERRDTKEGH